VLLEPEGCEGEGGARDHRARRAQPELAREQVRAEEGERVGEEEEQVVADERRVRPATDQTGRRIADESVAEGERVPDRPEPVRVEEVERLMEQGVASPGRLPGLRQGVGE